MSKSGCKAQSGCPVSRKPDGQCCKNTGCCNRTAESTPQNTAVDLCPILAAKQINARVLASGSMKESALTTPQCPSLAAKQAARVLSSGSMTDRPCSNNNTIDLCPSLAAKQTGRVLSSGSMTDRPCSNNNTIDLCPSLAAKHSLAVLSRESLTVSAVKILAVVTLRGIAQ